MSIQNNNQLAPIYSLPEGPIVNILSYLTRSEMGVVAKVSKAFQSLINKLDKLGFDFIERLSSRSPTEKNRQIAEAPFFVAASEDRQALEAELDKMLENVNGNEDLFFDIDVIFGKLIKLGYCKSEKWMYKNSPSPSVYEVLKLFSALSKDEALSFIERTPNQFIKFIFAVEFLHKFKIVNVKTVEDIVKSIPNSSLQYMLQYRFIELLTTQRQYDKAFAQEKKLVDSRKLSDHSACTTTKSSLQLFIFTQLVSAMDFAKAIQYMESMNDLATRAEMEEILHGIITL